MFVPHLAPEMTPAERSALEFTDRFKTFETPRGGMTHTRQPRVGPLCPVCHDPLWNHVSFPSGKTRRVRNGRTSRPCFTIGEGAGGALPL